MNDNLNNIYFTDDFKKDILMKSKSIRLSSFRIGEYSSDVPRDEKLEDGSYAGIKYINYDYMSRFTTLPNGSTVSDRVHPSISENPFDLPGVYNSKDGILHLYILPVNGLGVLDEGIYDNDLFKIIYVLYTDILTNIEKLAFVIYNEDTETNSPVMELLPLNLSKYNNLVSIKIPFNCEIITGMNNDVGHLESSGVRFKNYYSLTKDEYNDTYVGRKSSVRRHLNSMSSDIPMIGCSSINKFGLKLS